MDCEEWLTQDEGVARFGMELHPSFVAGAKAAWLASRKAALEEAAKVCEEKGKFWQSLNPNIISPVACAAADCSDAILALIHEN